MFQEALGLQPGHLLQVDSAWNAIRQPPRYRMAGWDSVDWGVLEATPTLTSTGFSVEVYAEEIIPV